MKKVWKTTRPLRHDLTQIPNNYKVEVRNIFKGLDLIECLRTMAWRFMTLETGSKTIPKKKKFKNAKWLFEEALRITVKRREVKSKGEKERYTHLNAVSKNSNER